MACQAQCHVHHAHYTAAAACRACLVWCTCRHVHAAPCHAKPRTLLRLLLVLRQLLLMAPVASRDAPARQSAAAASPSHPAPAQPSLGHLHPHMTQFTPFRACRQSIQTCANCVCMHLLPRQRSHLPITCGMEVASSACCLQGSGGEQVHAACPAACHAAPTAKAGWLGLHQAMPHPQHPPSDSRSSSFASASCRSSSL